MLWRARVAEAARLAAADLDPDHEPALRWLHDDLWELIDRLTAEAEDEH